jgi:hypothetical protein
MFDNDYRHDDNQNLADVFDVNCYFAHQLSQEFARRTSIIELPQEVSVGAAGQALVAPVYLKP